MIGFTTHHKSLQEYFADKGNWQKVSVIRALVSVYPIREVYIAIAIRLRKRLNVKSLWKWNYQKSTTYEYAMYIFRELNI